MKKFKNWFYIVVVTTSLVGASVVDAGINEGLKAFFPLEGNAHDLTGNGHDGTIFGDPQTVTGSVGSALRFDGNGDYVSTPSFAGQTEGSIAFWFLTDQNTVGEYLSSRSLNGYDDSDLIISGCEHVNELCAIVFDGSGWSRLSTTIQPERWYHLAFTWDRTGKRLFLDGELVDQNSNTRAVFHDLPLEIGRDSYSGGQSYNRGVIDEIRIYDRALLPEEITDLMNMTAYYSFDADTVVDDSGRGNDGTVFGGVTFNDGVVSRSIELNNGDSGQEDYISLPPISWESFTVAHWLRIDSVDPADGGVTYSVGDQGSANSFLGIWVNGEGGSFAQIYHEDHYTSTALVSITPGQWHHVAVTVDRTKMRYYLDGAMASEVAIPPEIAYSMVDEPGFVGAHEWWNGGGFDARFNGGIDELRLYDRVLSPTEIKLLAGVFVDGFEVGDTSRWSSTMR